MPVKGDAVSAKEKAWAEFRFSRQQWLKNAIADAKGITSGARSKLFEEAMDKAVENIAAHAVAEARAPLVEALRSCLDSLTFISKELGSDGRWKVWSHPAHSMAQARAALAKETP